MTENNYKQVIKPLHEGNLIYAFIGELISADNNMTEKDCIENKNMLAGFISALNDLKKQPNCEIPKESLEKYIETAVKSMSIFDK